MEPLVYKSFLIEAFLLLAILPIHFSHADSSSYNTTERDHLSSAFAYVSGFHISFLLPNSSARNCGTSTPPLSEIRLPSRNLRGTVSWILLSEIPTLRVLDLSGNALQGSIPAGFWSAPGLVEVNLADNRLGGAVGYDPAAGRPPSPSLRALNLSGNRFTNSIRLSGFPRLRVLDLSRNDLNSLPPGLGGLAELAHLDISACNISGHAKALTHLRSLRYLDASRNRMSGSFPVDLPPIAGLDFLNISFNNFTGRVAPEQFRKFGFSAFIHAGALTCSTDATAQSSSFPEKRKAEEKTGKRPSLAVVLGLAVPGGLLSVLAIAVAAACVRRRRKRTMAQTKNENKRRGDRSSGKVMLDVEAGAAAAPWVAELAAAGPAVGAAPVVMLEKPLMQLMFSELAAATSGFGIESQLAEGRRSGPVYRAVLPGGIDVVVKVLEKARDVAAEAARAAFEELGRLKHPNVVPLLGYCIAGRAKLLLYEYMDNGDLHRWLRELPAGHPNAEDWSSDTWDNPSEASRGGARANERITKEWETRHRIAVGIARGLAFLHHAGSRPIVHGNLVSSNVLLDVDFEPRIADFVTSWAGGGGDGSGGSTEEDVYCYGLVLIELLTGRVGSVETVGWVRGLVKGREAAARCLDPRLSGSEGEQAEMEMVEALRVAFLCTAESSDKRPTMRQVVGLLKDIRTCSLT